MRLNDRARGWLPWLLLAAAIVVTAAVYWPGLTGGWVFDDYPNIVQNNAIHITPGHSTLVAWVNAALSSPASFLHRPLASITFALNWYFGGGDPWPFKLTNIIIHLVNGVLVFCMLRALLRLMALRGRIPPMLRIDPLRSEGDDDIPPAEDSTPPPSAGRGIEGDGFAHLETHPPTPAARPPSFRRGYAPPPIDEAAATRLALVVATAWMLLPINLMAVLYVVQRMESLCQVFVLAGLWAYLHGRWMMLTARDARRDRRGFVLAVAGVVLGTIVGLTSKETAVLLPVFAFLAEWILLRFRREAEPLALRERGRGEGTALPPSPRRRGVGAGGECTDTREVSTSRGPGASPTPSGHPLPNGEGSGEVNLSPSAGRGIEGDGRGRDHRILWMFVVTLLVPAVLGFLWLLKGVLAPGALSGRSFTLGQRLLTEPRVLVDYLHWTIAPNPMVLSLYHDEIVKSTGLLTPWTTLGAIVVLAVLIVTAILLRNRRPLVSLGIGWFFAAQLLTATIIPLELVYEQRMYFASIGVLLALGAWLLGLRWRIRWLLLRGVVAAAALVWFGAATYSRAQEWSNPIRLAVAEANRHPTSARAVYEAGRLLLIASNYQPGKQLDDAWKYLRETAVIPGSSALSEQAMIMIADHEHQADDDALWRSMTRKLRDQPTRQEDMSALISLTHCYGAGICKFDTSKLQRAYLAALSRPHPAARLTDAYAVFQRDIMHNDKLAKTYLERAVAAAPGESAYRVDLAALYARHGQTGKAMQQIDALRHMNFAGRLDRQIAMLEQLAERSERRPAPDGKNR